MPDVSILLPCYNTGSTLDEALESLAAQTYSDFEAICVNDGSTDHTSRILESRRKKDSRFQVIQANHGGVVQAANLGLEFCRAPVILRFDADDRCHPQRVELQRKYLQDHPEIAVVGSLVKGFPEDQIGEGFRLYYDWLNSLVTHQEITQGIFVESPLANPSSAFRRSWIQDLGGYQDQGWPEDYDLWLRFYLAGARFAKVPEVLLEWREHPERLTHTDSRYSLENFLRAKAHYIAKGPARGRDGIFIWGAGMTGRRLSKHLVREGLELAGFVDPDPKKIGKTRRGISILSKEELGASWGNYQHPILFTAVRARAAGPLIRASLEELNLVEGRDWLAAA